MNNNLTQNMIHARAAEKQSPHPTHKVGAYLRSSSENQSSFNYWPEQLTNALPADQKLGNASTTIHAEISALIRAKSSTNQTQIYVTDLPCPNCVKTMAEAGIVSVYIDSHTHDTPLGIKMKPYFKDISLLMFERAMIEVYEIDRSKNSITTLLEFPPRQDELVFAEAHHQKLSEASLSLFREQIKELDYDDNYPFAACIANDVQGNSFLLSARARNAMGLSKTDAENIIDIQDKYEPIIQPFNRLLGQCAYYNLKIRDGYFFASQTPTAREFVNMIGYDLTSIIIGNPEQCRDKWGLLALKQIREYNILDVQN